MEIGDKVRIADGYNGIIIAEDTCFTVLVFRNSPKAERWIKSSVIKDWFFASELEKGRFLDKYDMKEFESKRSVNRYSTNK